MFISKKATYVKPADLISLENETEKFEKGLPIDESIVSPIISDSWIRSRKFGIDRYKLSNELLLTNREIQDLSNCQDLELNNADIIALIKEISNEMDLVFTLYDTNARIMKVLAIPVSQHDSAPIIFKDASENVLGTNAVCLALRENIPVQVLGPAHYNSHLNIANCSAAPIHSVGGAVSKVINISSFNTRQTIETLGLVTSIARVLENSLVINNMIEKLTIFNSTLNEIIEYLPGGIVYLNDSGEVVNYNKRLLDLFEINETGVISEKIRKSLRQIDVSYIKTEIENKEIVLSINNKKRSYLISTKKICNNTEEEKGCLIMLDDTNKILKLQSTLRGNRAWYTFEDIIGENDNLKEVKALAKKVACSPSAILIHGESGTGKELFAQSIHNESNRKDKPFVAVNCGAIPSELIESELFGYEPGAFTGALKGGKPGKLEIANGGTFFLDEIDSMPLNIQTKLLRALSANKITRIGGLEEIPIDIRLVAATKKDLWQESGDGNFREDLYFRISVIILSIPALRDRKDDIPILAECFVDYFAKQLNIPEISIDTKFLEALTYYYWRGNVRELRNVIERAILLLNKEKILTLNSLPQKILNAYTYKSVREVISSRCEEVKSSGRDMLKTSEEIIIELILKEEDGNLTKTADRLGISRPTLYKKIEQYPKLKKCKEILHRLKM
jgi:transcriptional regulator with PAS, ATPase and Fis domain